MLTISTSYNNETGAMVLGVIRRRLSSAVPCTEIDGASGKKAGGTARRRSSELELSPPPHPQEQDKPAAATTALLPKTAAAERVVEEKEQDDDHHVPRLLKPLPRVPWHRPHRPAAATAAAAWAPSSSGSHDRSWHAHRAQLLSREEAPKYLTGNPFVLHGFRRVETLWEAVDGLFYIHNSFWDAYTSIGSFLHSHVLLYLAHAHHGAFAHDALSSLTFILFYLHVAWVHAPASVACHLIGNAGISEHVHALSLELDYVCIFLSSLLLGFCMAVFVYPWWATGLTVAAAAALLLYLATHLRRVVLCHVGRLRMLLGIGSLYQLPLWVQAGQDLVAGYRAGHLDVFPSLPLSLVCAAGQLGSLALGGGLYAFHFPERLAPGKFDNFTSHALMHVCINLAFFSEYIFLVHMFQRHKGEI